MRLLQRVATLIRANINDLLDRAEDPETMIKQLIMDMNNQFIQVKTTVVQALADQHLMEKRLQQTRDEAVAAQRHARLAVEKGNDVVARAALERFNSFTRTATETEAQLTDQNKEVEALKLALCQLETKIAEVTRQRDILLARQRRATAKEKLAKANGSIHPQRLEELLDAIGGCIDRSEASAQAHDEMQRESNSRQLAKMEEDNRVDEQLAALKAKVHNKAD
jgi:phage shock protein A